MADRKRSDFPAGAAVQRTSFADDEPIEGRNLADIAYDRIETAFVHLELRPGMFLTISYIQELVGLGRTPVLDAIRKLADDTLLTVLSRRGLRVAPISLDRERHLVGLRRDVERFTVRFAAERATSIQRSQMVQIARTLRGLEGTGDVLALNELDRRLDRLIIEASAEPFVERVLRPLHTIFRRTGYIYLAHLDDGSSFAATIARHADLLTAVADGRAADADAASDAIIDLSSSMFDALARGIDPAILDASIAPLTFGGRKERP